MLPSEYQWVNQVGILPRILQEALKEFGTVEVAGPGDNQKILGWARELGLSNAYSHDSIAWCALFIAICAWRAGKPIVPGPLWALNWAKWGANAGQPELGDVMVFVRPGGGHVGLYIGEDPLAYHVLGGNQSDQVCIKRLDKHRLYAARNLYTIGPPTSARPYFLSDTGVISENEA